MSTLVYYESWKFVGEEEFADVHSSVSSRMLPRFGPVLVLIDRLLKYDIYMGSGIPGSIKMIATVVMLYQVVSAR